MEHSSLWISTVILNICTSQMVVLESFAGEHYYSIYWKIAPSELEFGPSCLAFPVDRGVCVQAVIGPCLSNASGVSLEGRSAPLTPTLAVLVILTVSAHTSQPVLTRSGSSHEAKSISLSFQKNKTPYVGCRVENTPLHYLATPAEDVDALRGIGVNGFYSVT